MAATKTNMGLLQFFREVIGSSESESTSTRVPSGSYRQNIVTVNSPHAAMSLSAVFRAVELTSAGVACMPLHIKRLNKAKGYYTPFDASKPTEVEGAYMDYLLSVRPNERMTSTIMIKGR